LTGYDLVKLMAGSRGTLGVLSEVAFKLLPRPETEATLALGESTPEAAVAAMAAALGSPQEVNGAARLPDGRVVLRLEGFAASVKTRAQVLAARLARYGDWATLEAGESAALWANVRDVAPFHGLSTDVWRVDTRPSSAPGIIARAGGGALMDWGGGLIWLSLPEGTDLRARLGAFEGHATLIRASAATRRAVAPFHPEEPRVATLSQALRARFDPRGILNPGLMG
jgi:glycolate oxidase FAD binding subunit